MSDSVEFAPFAEAADYYAPFRAPYAPEALDYIVDALGLDRRSRVLDLGCGPGTVAIPLSNVVSEVVAVDPDRFMLARAKALAEAAARQNIRWIKAKAEQLSPDLGSFRVVTMGQSFHWMDRDRVLRQIAELLEDGGGLAILDEGARRPQESWENLAASIAAKYLGRRGRNPLKHPEVAHAPSLLRSTHFSNYTVREFPTQITRDPASILGCIYSGVGISRTILGDRALLFEAELKQALFDLNPSGRFEERLETAVILASRR